MNQTYLVAPKILKPLITLITLIGGALFVAICLLAIFLSKSDQENVRHKGTRLSKHLIIAFSHVSLRSKPEHSASRHAVGTLGTNCVPLLGKWLSAEVNPWQIQLGLRLWTKGMQSSILPPEDRRLIAIRAVAYLNTNGVPLSIHLAAAATNENRRVADEAAQTLMRQFLTLDHIPVSLQDAIRLAIHRSESALEIQSLHDIGVRHRLEMLRKTRHRFEVLILRLDSLGLDEQARTLRLLSRRGERFTQVEPHLLRHLLSTNVLIAENAAICLKNYGAQASNTLPHLKNILSHPDFNVRTAATNAIVRITALTAERRRPETSDPGDRP